MAGRVFSSLGSSFTVHKGLLSREEEEAGSTRRQTLPQSELLCSSLPTMGHPGDKAWLSFHACSVPSLPLITVLLSTAAPEPALDRFLP